MLKLKVKITKTGARIPEVAHIGEDFGYDVFSAEDEAVVLYPGMQKALRTGVALEMGVFSFDCNRYGCEVKVGLIAKQPSGLAMKRMVDVKAGVIDAGYRNEILILLFNYGKELQIFHPGEKIGQLVPFPVFAGPVESVAELSESKRGLAGWGSGKTEKSIK